MAERYSERWWTWAQAVHFVLANRPCENLRNAEGHLACHIAGDSFPVRWWIHCGHIDNVVVPIAGLGRDWVMDRDLGRDPFERYGNGEIVLEAAAVRRFCEAQLTSDGPSQSPSQERRAPEQVKRETAKRVLAQLYPNGVPDRASVNNKPLYAEMCAAGFTASYSTAMRAAGRRK